MGIKTVTCYVAACDGCGEDFEGDYVPHFPTELDARQWVRDYDGEIIGDKVWCENCIPLCECGHAILEHDHGEDMPEGCEDCDCIDYKPAEPSKEENNVAV